LSEERRCKPSPATCGFNEKVAGPGRGHGVFERSGNRFAWRKRV